MQSILKIRFQDLSISHTAPFEKIKFALNHTECIVNDRITIKQILLECSVNFILTKNVVSNIV